MKKSVRKGAKKSVRKSVRKGAKKSVRKSVRKGAKKSVRKGAKKSVRKAVKKSARKTKRSYRMDPPRNGPASDWPISTAPEQRFVRELPRVREENPRQEERVELLALPRKEIDDRTEMVRRLIENAREGNATSADAYNLLTAKEKKVLDNIYAGQRLTPAEAFWQKEPYSLPSSSSSSSSSTNGWKKGWKKERTPAEIANMAQIKEAEQYSMMCIKPGCPMYGKWGPQHHV
jgi:hypothetical protein